MGFFLQIIKRQRFAKLPTQANYYPLAGVGYIEDKKARLTIATAQPLGATSMASGQFEVRSCFFFLYFSSHKFHKMTQFLFADYARQKTVRRRQ